MEIEEDLDEYCGYCCQMEEDCCCLEETKELRQENIDLKWAIRNLLSSISMLPIAVGLTTEFDNNIKRANDLILKDTSYYHKEPSWKRDQDA